MTDRRGDPLLSLQNVSVHFEKERLFGLAGSETVHAVDDVSLDIYENDIVALVGESGCGKTTLGKTAIGVQRPTEGNVLYRGQDVWETKESGGLFDRKESAGEYSAEEIRRSLQMIHQDPGSSLNSNYTVESSLADPLKHWQPEMSEADRRARIYGLLEYVGMAPAEDYAKRYPHQLSGGEQQRVALIRALLMNPDLILADEAISALDVSLRAEMMDLMLELQDQFNTSYLYISHDLANAKHLTQRANGRIGIMYLGELVEIGTPEQIIHDPQHPYTKVLLWATSDLRNRSESVPEPPIRTLDIPDPVDPPSGCRFHTRCPEARTACTESCPSLADREGDGRRTACFRNEADHAYWESEPLSDDGRSEKPQAPRETADGD
ncbi:oligopeptide/dipeptide ABC transporter, ATPase subunit [Haladaptatus paucihalophilus DX253]|uniref:Oligopeptide/dipeptide ABC transporter, ATPase subunit n=1 Tax=Haladaptatus paucihalophilus DX253 TaxID=797209 RepID=E7QVJ7_HALPU|nr:ABC transporter ATP-binding protein [Haladaptatus paucihalophilus]EFW91260.1 oligopeptide/dipeptide ABC transporter, ATPase subunit [Haladaptatus paucihalophilus DX253]SHL09034.1 peptide/nickel transport system ATP-binding protein [Haladaptatus paucihalophilus DX253]